MLVLDELVRLNEYVLEMSRASVSSWLTSTSSLSTNITRQDSQRAVKNSGRRQPARPLLKSIDLLMTKAMLHSAQMEAKEEREKPEVERRACEMPC
jgi:hypothetical protein